MGLVWLDAGEGMCLLVKEAACMYGWLVGWFVCMDVIESTVLEKM